MSSELVPFGGGSEVASRDVRRVRRGISQSHANAELRVARSFDAEEVTLAKLDVLTTAAGAAVGHAARIAKLQSQLELENPSAAPAIAAIAAAHTQLMVSQLHTLQRDLRCR